jgi:stearoyl-CoA desaturase (delta-9 desaturase)
MELISTERVKAGPGVSATEGWIQWAPVKLLWFAAHAALGLAAAIAFPSWQAFGVFLALSAITLCAGH